MTRKGKVILSMSIVAGAAVIVAAIVGGVIAYRAVTESPLKRALPAGASGVVDTYCDMGSDYSYYLRADISPKDLAVYCSKVGLTPHSPTRTYTDDLVWLSWTSSEPLPWWRQSPALISGTFVSQSGGTWTFAKYEQGVAYVKSLSH